MCPASYTPGLQSHSFAVESPGRMGLWAPGPRPPTLPQTPAQTRVPLSSPPAASGDCVTRAVSAVPDAWLCLSRRRLKGQETHTLTPRPLMWWEGRWPRTRSPWRLDGRVTCNRGRVGGQEACLQTNRVLGLEARMTVLHKNPANCSAQLDVTAGEGGVHDSNSEVASCQRPCPVYVS